MPALWLIHQRRSRGIAFHPPRSSSSSRLNHFTLCTDSAMRSYGYNVSFRIGLSLTKSLCALPVGGRNPYASKFMSCFICMVTSLLLTHFQTLHSVCTREKQNNWCTELERKPQAANATQCLIKQTIQNDVNKWLLSRLSPKRIAIKIIAGLHPISRCSRFNNMSGYKYTS
jgi:hypothetical protein